MQVEEPERSLLEELCPLPLVRGLGAAWAEHAQITRLGLALGLALPQLIGHLGLLVLPAIVEVVEIVGNGNGNGFLHFQHCKLKFTDILP